MTIQTVSNEVPKPEAVAAKPAEAEVKEPKETASAPGVETPEQKPAVTASETVAPEGTEKPAAKAEETEEETETLEAGETEKPNKKKGGFQRRIDKLNARYSEKEREVEYWRQQALKASTEPEKKPETPVNKPAAGDGKPNPDSFMTHAEFVEALTDWKTDQKLKERDQKAEKSRLEIEQAKIGQTYNERVKEFAKKTPDFEEAMEDVADIKLSIAVRDLILASENGPELAYALAKDKTEFARICALSPFQAARAIGKFEAALTSKPSETKETKTITSAPKPIAPVGGGGKASVPKNLAEAAEKSFADYKKLREEQIKKRRQA